MSSVTTRHHVDQTTSSNIQNLSSALLTDRPHESSKQKRPDHSLPVVHGLFGVRAGTKTVTVIKGSENHTPIERMLHTHKKIQHAIGKMDLDVKSAQQPPLSEELQALEASLKSLPAAQKISTFCSSYVQKALKSVEENPSQDPQKNPNYLEAQEFLAEVIFLIDKRPNETQNLFNEGNIPQSIHQTFSQEMENISKNLTKLVQHHNDVQLQDIDMMISIQKPIAIAHILITNSGFLNIGLSDQIKQKILNSASHLDFEENIVRVLDELRNTPALRQKVQEIVRPGNSSYNSNTVIRTVLGMAPDAPITDSDAKKVALSGIFSHLRQGPVGSCFATYLGVELLNLRLDKCLEDFKSLIKNDEIYRTVDGQRKDFDYILDISDDDVNSRFDLGKNGVLKSGASLADSPGIQAACRMMGIRSNDTSSILDTTFQQITKTSGKHSASEVIDAIAQNVDKNNAKKLADIGKFAFSSQTNNALLRVWESSIAGMAECRPSSYVFGTILQSINQALSPVLKPTNVTEKDIIKKINDAFLKTINDHMVLRFDPNIKTGGVSSDGHSTEGGFVIYQGDENTVSATGTRIDDPYKFQTFVQSLLKMTSDSILATLRVKSDQTTLTYIMQKVGKYVAEDKNFLKLVITNYDPDNKNVKDPLTHWERLEHAPWIDKTGDDNWEVLSVYMDKPRQAPLTIKPKTAKDLLAFGIKFARDLQNRYHYLDDDTPQQTFPCSTPSHAFSFIPEHPTMAAAVRATMTISDWIDTYVVQPGAKLAQRKVSKATKDKIVSFAHQTLVPPHHQKSLQSALAENVKENITLRELRSSILSSVMSTTNAKASQLNEISKMLDSYILKGKSNDELLTQWQKSIIHFADTNWNDGTKNIHFCIYFNPASHSIEFGTINEDNTNLDSVDPDEWVTNQLWEFYQVELQTI